MATRMKIAVLGTGMVGRAHAEKLAAGGQDVVIGTGNVETTLASSKKDAMGNSPFGTWYKEHAQIPLDTFANAAAKGEVIINALNGAVAVQVLKPIEYELADKILIDISIPLDFSLGFPPSLSVCNTNSLGEEIQKALPRVKVVKTLVTMTAALQVNARAVSDGDHTNFIAGNDADARSQVAAWLKDWYGWTNFIDLGDITNARGMEMALPLWVRVFRALKTPMFNFKVVK